jgi:voltage-gated potassium channel Kch
MAVLWTSILGIVVVAWTLREIFRDLFQPSGAGSLSSFMARRLFQLSKHVPSTMRVAGPLCIVVVIVCWTFLVAAGFALIYWGRFPQAFHAPVQESHEPLGRFWAVLYFSLASLTTLGAGDLVPQGSWIRIVTAGESLIGMSLISAGKIAATTG